MSQTGFVFIVTGELTNQWLGKVHARYALVAEQQTPSVPEVPANVYVSVL
jgi:hypothetical protein